MKELSAGFMKIWFGPEPYKVISFLRKLKKKVKEKNWLNNVVTPVQARTQVERNISEKTGFPFSRE